MIRNIEIGVIVSSYQRPAHLMRTLTSIELQQGVEGKFEVVISDDGSEDETAELVQAFADRVDFPVTFVTHPHDGFQLARCRNSRHAVRSDSAPFQPGQGPHPSKPVLCWSRACAMRAIR